MAQSFGKRASKPCLGCDRPAVLVDVPNCPPLGTVDALAPWSVTVDWPDGAALIGHTDGLIERRNESLDTGLDRLLGSIRLDEPDIICRELMDAVIGDSVPFDDIALIVMRRGPGA